MRQKETRLEHQIRDISTKAKIWDRPYTKIAEAFLREGNGVRSFRFFVEEGNAADRVNRAGGSGSTKGLATAEWEARRIVRKLGVGEVFRWSEAYEFIRTTGRGVDGYDYTTDPPTDVFRVVTDYAEVLVVRDVLMDADARAEAGHRKGASA